MTDLPHKVVSALSTGEGYFLPNSIPNRANNPGDLIATPSWKGKTLGRFRHYDTLQQGIADATRLVCEHIALGHTLTQLMYVWAPPSDGNDTENYIRETARRVGIDPSKPLWDYLEVEHIP